MALSDKKNKKNWHKNEEELMPSPLTNQQTDQDKNLPQNFKSHKDEDSEMTSSCSVLEKLLWWGRITHEQLEAAERMQDLYYHAFRVGYTKMTWEEPVSGGCVGDVAISQRSAFEKLQTLLRSLKKSGSSVLRATTGLVLLERYVPQDLPYILKGLDHIIIFFEGETK